jgi:hypothetical protein
MNERERIMAAALVCLLVVFGGWKFYGRYTKSAALSATALETASSQLRGAQRTLGQSQRAMRLLEAWQEMSLPADRNEARRLYGAWIDEKAKEAGLNVTGMTPNDVRGPTSDAYKPIGYTVAADGQLSSLVKFLYEFYRRANLHQITRLSLTPKPGSQNLDISMQIEALILPGATHEDSLPDGKSDRLKLASADEYEKQITSRDVFKPYTPPRPPDEVKVADRTSRPQAENFDDASQAKFTAVVNAGADSAEAWITVHTTDVLLRLHEGDTFEVGTVKGTVESIEIRSMVVKTADDKQLRFKLGNFLLDPEAPADSEDKPEGDKPAAPSES